MLCSNKINNQSVIKCLIIVTFMAAAGVTQIEGKQLSLVPLSAPDVYKILGEGRNLDINPEGKTVSHALAAGAGFAAGVANGLTGVLLLQVLTANITDPDETTLAPTATEPPATKFYAAKEICFGSRSPRRLQDMEYTTEEEEEDNGFLDYDTKSPSSHVRKTKTKRRRRPLRQHSFHSNSRKSNSADSRGRRRRRRPSKPAKFDLARFLTYPTTTSYEARTPDQAITATGTGTGTIAGNATPITCVVVEKPAE